MMSKATANILYFNYKISQSCCFMGSVVFNSTQKPFVCRASSEPSGGAESALSEPTAGFWEETPTEGRQRRINGMQEEGN